jgi:hypothetical protein
MLIDLETTVIGQSGHAFAVVADQDDRLLVWAGVDCPLGLDGE